MKLFQQLLLAPAVLGLLAPVAATAAEVNINDVAGYARKSTKQLRAAKAAQFSDVVPGDWAYTALLNLSESYGCVDNAYTQNLKNGQALTRYEAAALVNSCLDGGLASAGVDADVTRLTSEFGSEMAILKGRVDGLEYKVQELSAGQFSPNSKVSNTVVFNTGYAQDDANITGNAARDRRLNMTYTATTDIKTSFTGSDQLYVQLEAGNGAANDPFHSVPTQLADSATTGNALNVQKLWYTNTIGDSGFRYWVGPRIMSEAMLASSPTIYTSILEGFENGGNGSTYGSNNANGPIPGFGLAWTQQKDDSSAARFEVSTNYVALNGATATGGLFTDNQSKWLTKLGYGTDRWQVSAAVSRNMCDDTTPATDGDSETCVTWGGAYATDAAGVVTALTGNQTSYALRGYWTPESSGAVPSIQLGYDWSTIEDDNVVGATHLGGAVGSVEATQAWMAGLIWEDVFADGNTLGIAFGHPEHATEYHQNLAVRGPDNDPANKAFQWEAYYDYQVNDGITITPAIFGYQDRMNGTTLANDGIGGLIKTTFKF